MPSFSFAISRIGRFFAACEISISDFGFWCCEAGMTRSCFQSVTVVKSQCSLPRARTEELSEDRSLGEVGGFQPLAGVDLLAVGRLHAGDLEAAVGADDGE